MAASSALLLLLAAAVALGLGGATPNRGPQAVVVQPPPVAAAATRPADTTLSPATTTSTIPPTAVAAPTVVATTAAPPTTAPAPRVAPAPRATTAHTAAPVNAAAATTSGSVGGSASDFSLIGYRWNPCRVITVASTGPDITAIVGELASITGLHLQIVSGTANITVEWGPVPPGGEIGLTAWQAVGAWLNLVGIVISPQAGPYLATVLRHELGHALGLGHAPRANEVMYPTVGHSSPTDYQAGDRAGLRSVGASAGC